jgi:hypothetical protein
MNWPSQISPIPSKMQTGKNILFLSKNEKKKIEQVYQKRNIMKNKREVIIILT